jgi:transposase-like protein
MRKRHDESFKLNTVSKALKRGPGETLEQVAQGHGIGYSTLTRWMHQVKQGQLSERTAGLLQEKRPKDWTVGEKLQALMDTAGMDDSQRHGYCRQHGFYAHHLTQWKAELMNQDKRPGDDQLKTQNRALKEENRSLQRELKRKEKALAEAAALLVLKKKAQALFDLDEDN